MSGVPQFFIAEFIGPGQHEHPLGLPVAAAHPQVDLWPLGLRYPVGRGENVADVEAQAAPVEAQFLLQTDRELAVGLPAGNTVVAGNFEGKLPGQGESLRGIQTAEAGAGLVTALMIGK